MNMDLSITVIAPAYNHEKYIEQCLNSVAEQNCPNMELVVLDDKSTDNTAKIIKGIIERPAFKAAFERGIQFIPHTVNRGAHDSINEGLNMATGNFLTVINTDDFFGSDRLNKILQRCQEMNGEFAFGGIKVVNQNNQPVETGYGKAILKYQDTARKAPTTSMALTRGNSTISTGNMIFTRALYDCLHGFRNYKYVHDWDFALRAALLTEPIFVPEALYFYRLHEHNTIAEISGNPEDANKAENVDQGTLENPLVDFLKHIRKGNYKNTKIPPINVWEYFFYYKKYYSDDDAALWAWKMSSDTTK